MQIPVLIEPVAGNGFRARGGEPFAVTVEGATRAEAVEKLREHIKSKIDAGAEILLLDAPATEHPWAAFAGTLREDPLLDEWKQAMADYRKKVDEDWDSP